MNKLEEIHEKILLKNSWDNENSIMFYKPKNEGYEGEIEDFKKESAEITTDVAIKFSQWMDDNEQQREYTPMLQMSRQQLFEEFINNHYGK